MINKLTKVLANSALLSILLIMLALPMAFLGYATYEDKTSVLSAQDARKDNSSNELKTIQGETPKEVEDMIIKMEREMYENMVVNDSSVGSGSEPIVVSE